MNQQNTPKASQPSAKAAPEKPLELKDILAIKNQDNLKSHISPPMLYRVVFGLVGVFLSAIMLFLLANLTLEPSYSKLFTFPSVLYHLAFGVLLLMVVGEAFWLFRCWNNMEQGDIPGWAKIAVPADIQSPENSVSQIVVSLKKINAQRLNVYLVAGILPLIISVFVDLPNYKKESHKLMDVFLNGIFGSLETIILVSVVCVIHAIWNKLIYHWELIAVSGCAQKIDEAQKLRTEEAKLRKEIEHLNETIKILEETIQKPDGAKGEIPRFSPPLPPATPNGSGAGDWKPYPGPIDPTAPFFSPNSIPENSASKIDDWKAEDFETLQTDAPKTGMGMDPKERPPVI